MPDVHIAESYVTQRGALRRMHFEHRFRFLHSYVLEDDVVVERREVATEFTGVVELKPKQAIK